MTSTNKVCFPPPAPYNKIKTVMFGTEKAVQIL